MKIGTPIASAFRKSQKFVRLTIFSEQHSIKRFKFARNPQTSRESQKSFGFVTVELVAAVAFSLILFTMLTNFILMQYGRGIMRAAADESARVAARVGDVNNDATESLLRCKQRQDDVLKGLGHLGQVTTSDCKIENGQVVSTVTVKFQKWLPTVPTITDTAVAVSNKELAPK